MAFWFDQKHKEYAADGKESWMKAYTDKLFQESQKDLEEERNQIQILRSAVSEEIARVESDGRELDDDIMNSLDNEKQARQTQDELFQKDLNDEKKLRQDMYNALEKSMRQSNDDLSLAIGTEQRVRGDADKALGDRISAEELQSRIYDVDPLKAGADNNVLAITIAGVSSYEELDGKTIRVNTRSYSNRSAEPQTIYLNVNELGSRAIRRPIPALKTGYDTKEYYTDQYFAQEINRNTVLSLTFLGDAVIWNNPVPPVKATAELVSEGTDGSSYVTPKLAKEAFQSLDQAPNITKNPVNAAGDIIANHLTVGTRHADYSLGPKSVSFGENNIAYLYCSAAIGGAFNDAHASQSVVVGGDNNTASGLCSFASGQRCKSGGTASFIGGGNSNETDGNLASVLGGAGNKLKGYMTCAIGGRNHTINGSIACAAGGEQHQITGECAFAGGGCFNTVKDYNAVFGRYCAEPEAGSYSGTEGDALIVGIGEEDAPSTGLRMTYAGDVYLKGTVHSTGADYAELWEWRDGNPDGEDRTGRLVAMQGSKIRLAEAGDPPVKLGVISARPSVAGDSYSNEWHGKYQTDVFGRWLTEHKSHEAVTDENGEVIRKACESEAYLLSPDFDPSLPYQPRENRPEWDFVGTHGKLVVIDDGSCQPDGFCGPGRDGIATAAESGFYVMERLDDNHVRIYVR